MKMNNKGFAISTILYSLLVMATLILFLLVGNLSFERNTTDDFVDNIEKELNSFYETSEVNNTLLSDALLSNLNENNYYNDGTDTFITGKDPNNYILYTGKVWRAVLINNTSKTVKIITQDNVNTMIFSAVGDNNFDNSDIKTWLNDTSSSGFLGSLTKYQNFIVTHNTWYIDISLDNARPEGTSVTSDVGLLNNYEFASSFKDAGTENSYLLNNSEWWTLTRSTNGSGIFTVGINGDIVDNSSTNNYGVRPVINLKSDVKITNGDGSASNPYILNENL